MAGPCLIAQSFIRAWMDRTEIGMPCCETNSALLPGAAMPARTSHHLVNARIAGAPTGTMRSFAPFPQTRTSPVFQSTRSMVRPASSDKRNPDE